MPFQHDISDIDDIATSNPVRQVVFSILYIVSFLCLIPNRNKAILVLINEKFLTIFLMWCLLSISWSEFKLVSFKRWIQTSGSAVVSLSVLLTFNSADEASDYFKAILILYIPLTFLAILFIPGAKMPWENAAWRGLAPHKNHLGQVALASSIIWFEAFYRYYPRFRVSYAVMTLLSVILIFGSKSMTSILIFIFLVFAGISLSINKYYCKFNISRIFSIYVIVSFIITFLLLIYLEPDIKDLLFRFLGKDPSFTGRSDLWASIFEEAKKHLFLGCGFQGFWVIGNRALMDLYEEFIWLPNQSHLGYLDLLNEVGIIGLFLIILMVNYYFKNLYKLQKTSYFKWFLIATLIINVQESTLFRSNILTGVLFTFAYLALYADFIIQHPNYRKH